MTAMGIDAMNLSQVGVFDVWGPDGSPITVGSSEPVCLFHQRFHRQPGQVRRGPSFGKTKWELVNCKMGTRELIDTSLGKFPILVCDAIFSEASDATFVGAGTRISPRRSRNFRTLKRCIPSTGIRMWR